MPAQRGLAGLPGLGLGAAAAAARGLAGSAVDLVRTESRARDALGGGDDLVCEPDHVMRVRATDGIELYVEIDDADEGSPVPGAAKPDTATEPGQRAREAERAPAQRRPTVVLSHGYCLSLRSWIMQRRRLTEAGYRVVLWDQRGHGRSDRPTGESCQIDQLGEDLRCVIEAAAPEGELVLVGHSMGGMTVMALAAQHPDLIRDRVVSVGFVATSAGGAELISLGFGEHFGRLLTRVGPGLLNRLEASSRTLHRLRPLGRDVEDFFVEQLSFGSPVSRSLVRYTGDLIFGTPFTVMSDFLDTLDRHDKLKALAAFHGVETLVINGVQDILTPPEHSEAIVRLIPGAEHVVVNDAGHLLMLEHGELVAEQLIELGERGLRAVDESVPVAAKPRVRRQVTDVAKRRRLERARRQELDQVRTKALHATDEVKAAHRESVSTLRATAAKQRERASSAARGQSRRKQSS